MQLNLTHTASNWCDLQLLQSIAVKIEKFPIIHSDSALCKQLLQPATSVNQAFMILGNIESGRLPMIFFERTPKFPGNQGIQKVAKRSLLLSVFRTKSFK